MMAGVQEEALRGQFTAEMEYRRRIYREVFSTDAGKYVLADLIRQSGLFEFGPVSTEAAVRTVERWRTIAAIVNGMGMTDLQIADWAVAVAKRRAQEADEERYD